MIAAGMSYAIVVALLLGCAALATEHLFAQFRWPRRGLWLLAFLASLAIPCATLFEAGGHSQAPAPAFEAPAAIAVGAVSENGNVTSALSARSALSIRRAWPVLPALDSMLLGFWALTSCALLAVFLVAWLRFMRTARTWSAESVAGETAWLSESTGPAVFGIMRPRVVLPRRLLNAPEQLRSLVMQHEQAHIAALDPLLLISALLVTVLVPWNLPLWWQLRRLRFAVEVDCDARVLKRGADPVSYGEALLAVGRHDLEMPLGAVALTEPASQLERRIRIMMFVKPRHRGLLAGAFFALAATSVACATQLDAPQAEQALPVRKLPPRLLETWIIERLQALVEEHYPQLWQGKAESDPSVIFLFKADGTVERTDLAELAAGTATSAAFGRFGLTSQELGYVSAVNVSSSVTKKKISVIYAERKRSDPIYRYFRPTDVTAVDRAIVGRYFPALFRGDELPIGQLWVLLDSSGQVLRSGQEAVSADSSSVARAVMTRFPGIQIDPISTSQAFDRNLQPMMDRDGNVIGLFSLWLKPGSTLPDK